MVIKFQGEYKSLTTFTSDILENFSVITGKNGSGKSQLIALIKLKSTKQLLSGLKLDFEPVISKIQIEGIENPNLSTLNSLAWKSKLDFYLNMFNKIQHNTKIFLEICIENNTWPSSVPEEFSFAAIKTVTASELEGLIMEMSREIDPIWFGSGKTLNQILRHLFKNSIFSESIKQSLYVAKFASNFRKKSISDLTEVDFHLTPFPEYLLDEPKLFGSQIEFVFYNYAKRRDQNQRFYFDKMNYSRENDSISDTDFVVQFKPPWIIINEILDQYDLKFQFATIDQTNFAPEAMLSVRLIKTTIEKEINFQDLSSGEKIIIGLIVKLFTSQYYNDKLELPELIVLDEPDAHLHPEMSKLLIDVLQKTFVEKFKLKVIITTHSPSTIALCPDNSIYQLKNEPETTLQKIEKNDALKLLTDFIPTLSIDYNNHKQVFVESPTDVKFYQLIFNKLNQERNYPFNLYFISNGYGKGNCDQVKSIVHELRLSGSKTAYGIIDWDLKNSSTEFVKIHGESNRYSIENYLLDPIYIVIFLMEKNAHNVHKELIIEDAIDQYTIGSKSSEFLQEISNWFFARYYYIFKGLCCMNPV